MNSAETELAERLTKALRDGCTAEDLAAMRIAIRTRRDLTIHAVHNALTIALEDVAASKFGEDMTT